jgi:hypothetical protein
MKVWTEFMWLARVNAVMNLGIVENTDGFFTRKGAISF